MTMSPNDQPTVIFWDEVEILSDQQTFGRITKKSGAELQFAVSAERDAMANFTNWQAIDTYNEDCSKGIHVALAILHAWALKEFSIAHEQDFPAVVFQIDNNCRVVAVRENVFVCEIAEEVQDIFQWKLAPSDFVMFDIMTSYVLSKV
jgi:hypothetical protein